MTDSTEIYRRREIGSLPPATLDQLRDALFDPDLNGFSLDAANVQYTGRVAAAAAAGKLLEAGHIIPERLLEEPIRAAAALTAGRLVPPSVMPIIFSVTVGGAEQTVLTVVDPAPDRRTARTVTLVANCEPSGRIRLTPMQRLVERDLDDAMIMIGVQLRYLFSCKGAIEPVAHSSGIRYSRLDVEKAIRLKAAEKASVGPVALGAGDHPLTLGEVRQALMDIDESPRAGVTDYLLEAAQQAKTGRLFVLDNLPQEIVEARYDEAANAIGRGVLRAPFPFTAVLMKLERPPGVCLLGIIDSGFVDDGSGGHGFSFWAVIPHWLPSGKVDWRRSVAEWTRFDPEGFDAAGSYDFDAPYVILSLIADSRSSVTRVEADDKLNKARVKRGKPPILSYWKIEPPKPTVLVPNAAPAAAARSGGGTHASPRPHDRRGHPRHLKSGREVWVKACKINALLSHLTRGRLFYEVRLPIGPTP